ncbi:MAG: RNA polymerase sigma factor [Bacteroidota bacterium]
MIDETRFKTFYAQTSRPLLAYLLRVAGEKPLADDVFQESYVRMLQSDLHEPTDAKLKSYLFTTATNLVRDHWRRAKKSARWESEGTGDVSVTHHEAQADLRHDLGEALEGCSPQQRSLLWLAYVEGYQHKEIAEMLKLQEKSVKVLLFRARHKLKEALAAQA